MRVLSFAAVTLLVAGSINGDYNADASAPAGPADMAAKMYDLTGDDLAGAYNCSQLNACEAACTTAVCIYNCRNMATPPAVDKEDALQSCFQTFCPPMTVCMRDMMGTLTMACMVCLSNTYIPDGQACSPTQNPSECHQCVAQANACTADQ